MIKRLNYNSKIKDVIYKYIDSINKTELSVTNDIIKIINDVRINKDKALKKYEQKFDGVVINDFKVKPGVIKKAYSLIDKKVLPAMKVAIKNIEAYHKLQKNNLKDFIYKNYGYTIQQKYIPLNTVGIYIPGGQVPLFSTVFMASIPAKVAGVKSIILVSPPRYKGEINPYILVAADMIGIKEIYKIGGAQAIAALAYGTETIPRVDKIVGPGNIYSTMAKKYLFGTVGIDCINGPSEITIIADETANLDYIFYDLLAQAEHSNGHSLLITLSEKLASEIEKRLKNNFRNNDIDIMIIYVKNIKDGIDIINYKAPEHLLIVTRNPNKILKEIKNAPAIFIGNDTPVAFGDYIAGSNHILPTNGTGRFFSALSVLDFLKHTHIVKCTKNAIKKLGNFIELMADKEGLYNHSKSVKVRR
ncbi:MAG: histidinol dehydrogenase [Candidatus Goldbacteria bacterium]|nr:histidinol dehydrogenase [Candidatus Goldiibacteriota bacterium]